MAYVRHLYSKFIARSPPVTPSANTDLDEVRECRYRLDTSSSATITLSDGRELGYAQYGDLEGRPIFTLHGIPGSRLGSATWEAVAIKHNARLIAVDRPGIGLSSPHPNRTILDLAKDVQQLAEHLELDKYAMLGASGGGPYALGCAFALPADKLKGVSVVCGMGPPDMSKRGMEIGHVLGYTFGWHYFPRLLQWYFARDVQGRLDLDDGARLERSRKEIVLEKAHPRDAEWMKDTDFLVDNLRVGLRSARETYSRGFDALLQDGKLIASDFGFRMEDIRQDLPIQLWYGKYDTWVPPIHGEQSAERLGTHATLQMKDETHSSLIINHREQMLVDLLACF